MKIEMVPIEKLVQDPANARRHGKKNRAAIKESLERFGQTQPLVVRRKDSMVLVGNGRLAQMIELGWKEVEVHYVTVSDQEARALAIADNRTGELATWDPETLQRTLVDLPEGMRPGFTEKDIERLTKKLEGVKSTFAGVVRRCPKCDHEWTD